MIKKMHHAMMEHFGHEDFGSSLPETQIQAMIVGVSTLPLYPNRFISFSCCGMECSNEIFNLCRDHVMTLFLCLYFPNILNIWLFYFQANRQLDLACQMEISALCLKQSALHSWNIALAGTACRRLLHLLEDLFGLPESEMSKREGARLESSTYAAEPETAEEKAATVTESTASGSTAPPPLKRCKVLEMIARNPKTFTDKCKNIADASGYFLTPSIALNVTSVNEDLVEKPDEKLSVYCCALCFYCAKQCGQLFTHVRRVHLGICITCRLCNYRTYRGVDMRAHLCKTHPKDEEEWLEPLPDLEGVSLDPEECKKHVAQIKDELAEGEDLG